VSKSGFQRVSGSTYRRGCIWNEGAKPEHGHVAASVLERHSRHPKISRFNHGYISTLFCFLHHRTGSKNWMPRPRKGTDETVKGVPGDGALYTCFACSVRLPQPSALTGRAANAKDRLVAQRLKGPSRLTGHPEVIHSSSRFVSTNALP
jgi:hypothetical protein